MTHLDHLEIGQVGYVQPRQLYLVTSYMKVHLYTVPRFTTSGGSGLLCVTRTVSQIDPRASRYVIYLPADERYRNLNQTTTEAEVRNQNLIRIQGIQMVSSTPGQQPFAVAPLFYFKNPSLRGA